MTAPDLLERLRKLATSWEGSAAMKRMDSETVAENDPDSLRPYELDAEVLTLRECRDDLLALLDAQPQEPASALDTSMMAMGGGPSVFPNPCGACGGTGKAQQPAESGVPTHPRT